MDKMRGILLREYLDMKLPSEMILQRVAPMRGLSEEEKEAMAAKLLEEVNSGALTRELENWKKKHPHS